MNLNRFSFTHHRPLRGALVGMLAATCMMVAGPTSANAGSTIYVEDDNLERYLIELGFDSGELDNYISYSAAQRITRLDLSNMDINSFTGIESFGNLEFLDLSGIDENGEDWERLTFDSSSFGNRSLKTLRAVGSKITTIRIYGAPLETLDVSDNRNLTTLEIYGSKLKSVNLSGATDLEDIHIEGGSLTAIDLSAQFNLDKLTVSANRLTKINLAPHGKLTYLDVSNNQIQTIDLSKNLELQDLRIGNNELTALDLSKNALLSFLIASDNKLKTIDTSKNPSLRYLTASSNRLTSLNLAANSKLEGLGVANNKLTALDVSNLARLLTLDVSVNEIKSVDVRNSSELISVDVSYNPIRKLSLPTDLRLMMYVNISGTKIQRLDLRGGAFAAQRDGNANYMRNISYGGWGVVAEDSSATLIVDSPRFIKAIMGDVIDDTVKLVRK